MNEAGFDSSEDAGAPQVSVIVPCGPRSPRLGELLAALTRQCPGGPSFELVVVDNGAGIDEAELKRSYFAVRLVVEATPGAYAARNRGAAEARGDTLAFTDADCVPTPGWLSQGVAALRSAPHPDIVGGKVTLFARSRGTPRAIERHQLVQAFRQDYFVHALSFAMTANLFTPRELFARSGGFAAALRSGGDAEWCQRQAAAGATIRYAPEAEVLHPARDSWRSLARQRRRTTGGRFQRAHGVGHSPRPLSDLRSSYHHPWARCAHYRSHPLLAERRARLGFLLVELFLCAVTRYEQARLGIGGTPLRD